MDAAESEPLERHPCRLEDGEFDHEWHYISDWYGDPDVINGTADCSRWECERCGEIDDAREPPSDDGWDL